ncbi:MAG TPA: CapA family protein, partial [Ktedonobacterales bacterium]
MAEHVGTRRDREHTSSNGATAGEGQDDALAADQDTPVVPTSAGAYWQGSRRELLGGAATLAAAAVVAGCSLPFGQQTATRFALTRPATVAFDGTVPTALQAPLLAQLKGVAGIPSANAAASAQGADLVVTFGSAPSGYTAATIGSSPVTLVSHLRVAVDGVTGAQALQLLGGQASDWKSVGAPASLSVKLLALGGLALPSSIHLAASAAQHTTLDDLLTALRAQPGSLAAIPLHAADWQVRNLGVDGVFPAQGRGDATKGGAGMLTLQVGAANALVHQGLDLKAVAAALAPALVAGETVDMVAAGDIMLGRSVNAKMVQLNDYTYPYKGMHDELQSADVRVANLECTVTDLVQPPADPTTFTFITAKKAVTGLTYGGFNAVTVANNHAAGPG